MPEKEHQLFYGIGLHAQSAQKLIRTFNPMEPLYRICHAPFQQ